MWSWAIDLLSVAGQDAFRSVVLPRENLVYVFCRGRTWISDDMVRPDQTPIAAAPSGVESQLTIMTMMALKQAED
jgi:hypothetical protein